MMSRVAQGGAYKGRWRNGFASAVCLLALTASSIARAESVTIAVITPNEPGPVSTEALSEGAEVALTALGHHVVDGFALANVAASGGADPAPDDTPLAEARALMEEGWRSYLEVRASFAATKLSQARSRALEAVHRPGGRALVAELSLRLGVVKLDLGRDAEAGDDFRLAHVLAPERPVTDAEFKPEAVVAYVAALGVRSEVHERKVVRAPGQRLWIDGSEVFGDAVRLSEGLHLVEGFAIGRHPRATLISVSPGPAAALELVLRDDPVAQRALDGRLALRPGHSEREARDSLTAMLMYSETEALVAVASVWRRGAPALIGQRCSGVPAHCSPVVEIGYPESGLEAAMNELLRRVSEGPLRLPPLVHVDPRVVDAEARPRVKGPDPQPLWKNRWLWAGVAAAAAASTAVYLLAEPAPGKTLFTGDSCSFGGC